MLNFPCFFKNAAIIVLISTLELNQPNLCAAQYVRPEHPFPPAAGQPGSTAVAFNNPAILGWATGYKDYHREAMSIASGKHLNAP